MLLVAPSSCFFHSSCSGSFPLMLLFRFIPAARGRGSSQRAKMISFIYTFSPVSLFCHRKANLLDERKLPFLVCCVRNAHVFALGKVFTFFPRGHSRRIEAASLKGNGETGCKQQPRLL